MAALSAALRHPLPEPALGLLPGEEPHPRPGVGDVHARRPPALAHRPVEVEAPRRFLVGELDALDQLVGVGPGLGERVVGRGVGRAPREDDAPAELPPSCDEGAVTTR